MKFTNKMLLLALLSTALVACGKKEEPAAPATPAATAPAATPAPAAETTPAPATPAPATPAPTAPVAASTDTPAAASGLPEACEAYLTRATACYEKAASANAAAVDQMKQGLEQVRTQWNAVPDKSQLGAACTMANDQFAQTVTMLKCE